MPAKNEREFLHVRLTKDNSKKVRAISKRTRRSPNFETNLAVEQYKPKAIYVDNGK